MNQPIPWDELWINIAQEVRRRSKDPRTQVGCVLVSPDNRRLFVGYNGFARKVLDLRERWNDRVMKHRMVVHAEQNALDNRNCDVGGWTCYVTMKPCEKCASSLVNQGIKRIVYTEVHPDIDYDLADQILAEGGVEAVLHGKDTPNASSVS